MKLIKIRKKFSFQGITLKICLVEEQYLNAEQPVQVTRVVAPNGGIVPITVQYRESLKRIQERSIEILETLQQRGNDVLLELTQETAHDWTDEDFSRIGGNLNTLTNFISKEMGERGYGKGELNTIVSRGWQGKSMSFIEQANGRTKRENYSTF